MDTKFHPLAATMGRLSHGKLVMGVAYPDIQVAELIHEHMIFEFIRLVKECALSYICLTTDFAQYGYFTQQLRPLTSMPHYLSMGNLSGLQHFCVFGFVDEGF